MGKLLDDILEKYYKAKDYRQQFEDDWIEYYKLYRSFLEENEYPWRANLFIPKTFSLIETIVPRIVEAIFGNRPIVKVLPRMGDDINKAKTLNYLLEYQLDTMKLYLKIQDLIRDVLIYGTGICKIYWQKKVRKQYENKSSYDPIEKIVKLFRKTKNVVEYDDPALEHIDIFDFFIEPEATSIESAQYVIDRKIKSIKELEKLAEGKIYSNIDKVKKTANINEKPAKDRLQEIGKINNESSGNSDEVELLEYWEDDRVVTIANQAVIIRDEKNPYYHNRKPFIAVHDIKVSKEFYGIGEVEITKDLQEEINSNRNRNQDNQNISLNLMWLVPKSEKVNEEELISRPGGIIHTVTAGGIKPVQFPNFAARAYEEQSWLDKEFQDVTGVYDYARGKSPERQETATGIVALQEVANKRFQLKINNFSEELLVPLADFMIKLNQQFLSKDKVIRIVGKENMEWDFIRESDYNFFTISPEEVNFSYDIIPMTYHETNKTIQKQQILQLYNMLIANPAVNKFELNKMLLDTFDIKNAKALLGDPVKHLLSQLSIERIFELQKKLSGMVEQIKILASQNPNLDLSQPMVSMSTPLARADVTQGNMENIIKSNPTIQDRGKDYGTE